MSEFTFEENNTGFKLETFEWDNVWWEHTENTTAKRVAYVGDSISCGTRHAATALSENTILFDGFGTSKALDNPNYLKTLPLFFAQEQKIDAILFNNGLHGWGLPDERYEEEYRKMLTYLRSVSDAPLFVVLSTNLPARPERNEIVLRRNVIASRLAEEFGLPCIDLYSVSVQYRDMHTVDNVHFTEEGYGKLARCILDALAQQGIR